MKSTSNEKQTLFSQHTVCNLCGSDNYTVLFQAGVAQRNQIVRCNCCGLMYSNPRSQPPDCQLIEEYDPDFLFAHLDSPGVLQRQEKEMLQVRDYKNTRDFLRKHYPQKGKLVEVGSGFGYLLEFFKHDGWDVLGIEPNRGVSRYAQTQLGLDVMPVILETAQLPDASVDVLVMLHVIEHVPDPLATLKEVYRVLKPGGIVVLETPRYDTWLFKILGKRERSLSCEGHIYFFTTDTLQKMANKAEFKTLKTDYVGRSLTLDRLFYNLGVLSKQASIKRTLEKIARGLRFNTVSLYINAKDMERLYLQKTS
jgi:SAM-dependent methyltransferase